MCTYTVRTLSATGKGPVRLRAKFSEARSFSIHITIVCLNDICTSMVREMLIAVAHSYVSTSIFVGNASDIFKKEWRLEDKIRSLAIQGWYTFLRLVGFPVCRALRSTSAVAALSFLMEFTKSLVPDDNIPRWDCRYRMLRESPQAWPYRLVSQISLPAWKELATSLSQIWAPFLRLGVHLPILLRDKSHRRRFLLWTGSLPFYYFLRLALRVLHTIASDVLYSQATKYNLARRPLSSRL